MTIHIIKCGTQSPLGTWTSMSAANVRAGMARITKHAEYEDEKCSPVKVAMAGYLAPDIPNQYRFFKLGMAALEEAMVPLKNIDTDFDTVPLLIGMSGERNGMHPGVQPSFCIQIGKTEYDCTIRFDTLFFPFEHASGLVALKEAVKKFENKEAEFCVVGGIESYMNLDTLKWLEENQNLKCSDNKWGFVPGEAAGFCLLAPSETVEKYSLEPLAEVVAVAETREEKQNKKDTVCTGNGLSQAFTQVLGSLPEGSRVHQVFCDMNGQRHRVDEYGYSIMRTSRFFEDPNDIIAPANLWGDLGAASAPLLISLATEAGRKGYAKGPYNLVFTSSLGEQRAALLLKLGTD